MSLSADEVKKIAHLARVEINEQDIPEYAKNLNNILGFVEQMNDVDTNDVVPMAHPLDMAQVLRADEVTESNQREDFQAIAPATEDGLYLVPKVID